MKKLFSYLKDYRKESILGPLFKLLEAFFELIVPLVVAAIIDTGIGQGNRGYIVRMCLVLVALGLIGLLCSVTAQYFAAKASVGFTKKLRHALFAHIQGFSYQTLDTVGTSTIITRMTSDMNQVQTGLNLALRLLLSIRLFGNRSIYHPCYRYQYKYARHGLSLLSVGVQAFRLIRVLRGWLLRRLWIRASWCRL